MSLISHERSVTVQDVSGLEKDKSLSNASPDMTGADSIMAGFHEPLQHDYGHFDDITTVSMTSMSVQTSSSLADSLPILARNKILADLDHLTQHCESPTIDLPDHSELVRTLTGRIEEQIGELWVHLERLMLLKNRAERDTKFWQKKAKKSIKTEEKAKSKMKDMQMDLEEAQRKLTESELYITNLKNKLERRRQENHLLRNSAGFSVASVQSRQNSEVKGSISSFPSFPTHDCNSVDNLYDDIDIEAIEGMDVFLPNNTAIEEKINKMTRNLSLGERSLKKIIKSLPQISSDTYATNVESDENAKENQSSDGFCTDLMSSTSELTRNSGVSSRLHSEKRKKQGRRRSTSIDQQESSVGLSHYERDSSKQNSVHEANAGGSTGIYDLYDKSFHIPSQVKESTTSRFSWMDIGLKKLFGGQLSRLSDEEVNRA
eukprot:CAMPEP_0195302372 /NCGR_PEP_ID=MMETSP0707-20130614/30952_1 /TAXON_ID=33640 /ORGANISM="Asterionellopsis glacialis, Strain CCMP134" /LENGTH=431 /DNA_ID=CAMNT_0040365605 /DNA_START=35 /DNA_END=1330 /DNA_ORIENTATION=-